MIKSKQVARQSISIKDRPKNESAEDDMRSDIEIAQSAQPLPIEDVAAKLGLSSEDISHYG